MKRRELLAGGTAVAALAATGGLTGCSGFSNQSAPQAGGGSAQGPTPQTLMTWANPEITEAYRKTLANFTDQTGIEVTVSPVPSGEYFKKISSMTLSNSLPDVFWADNGSGVVAPMAANGKLYDWTSMLDNPPDGAGLDRADFGPGYLDLFTVDGKVIGMPQEVNTNGIYYNKRLLTEAGVTLPTPEWSWDDLFAAVESLAVTEGSTVKSYGMHVGWSTINDPFGMSMYSRSFGGPGLAGEASTTFRGVTSIEASAQFREGAQRFVEAIKAGGINGPSFSTQNSVATFMNGELPMMYGGQWFTGFFSKQVTDEWGFVTMPKGSNGSVAILEGNAFCSPANLKDPQSTWKLIHYMLTTGFNEAYAEVGLTPIAYTPGSKGFFSYMEEKSATESGYGEVAKSVEADLANPNKSGTSFLDKWANRAADVTKAVWNPMLDGKRPVDEAVDDYAAQVGALAVS
ncbi:ABC transporter substrate-binding protein [Propionibacteriaceae bacterium Y2011]